MIDKNSPFYYDPLAPDECNCSKHRPPLTDCVQRDEDFRTCTYWRKPTPLWRRIFDKLNPLYWWRRRNRKRLFTHMSFPLVKRVFPNMIANEIVSVQPMTAPSAALFYLDYTFGTNVSIFRNVDSINAQEVALRKLSRHDDPGLSSLGAVLSNIMRAILATYDSEEKYLDRDIYKDICRGNW